MRCPLLRIRAFESSIFSIILLSFAMIFISEQGHPTEIINSHIKGGFRHEYSHTMEINLSLQRHFRVFLHSTAVIQLHELALDPRMYIAIKSMFLENISNLQFGGYRVLFRAHTPLYCNSIALPSQEFSTFLCWSKPSHWNLFLFFIILSNFGKPL